MSGKLIVDEDRLAEWLDGAFGRFRRYRGDFLVCSPFASHDEKFKLSISPSKNAYHCWKTDESGNIPKLVAKIEGCSFREAIEMVCTEESVETFQSKIDQLKERAADKVKDAGKDRCRLPDCFRLVTLEDTGLTNVQALAYCVEKRHLDPIKWGVGYCWDGPCAGRLVVPFWKDGKIVYWTARALRGQQPKYLNPSDEVFGVKRDQVMFCPNHDFAGKDVFVLEGVFNAMTLWELGFHACAIGGRSISDEQIAMLRSARTVTLSFDNDSSKAGRRAGHEACSRAVSNMMSAGFSDLKYVFPPFIDEDWNDHFVRCGAEETKRCIIENTKHVDLKAEVLMHLGAGQNAVSWGS